METLLTMQKFLRKPKEIARRPSRRRRGIEWDDLEGRQLLSVSSPPRPNSFAGNPALQTGAASSAMVQREAMLNIRQQQVTVAQFLSNLRMVESRSHATSGEVTAVVADVEQIAQAVQAESSLHPNSAKFLSLGTLYLQYSVALFDGWESQQAWESGSAHQAIQDEATAGGFTRDQAEGFLTAARSFAVSAGVTEGQCDLLVAEIKKTTELASDLVKLVGDQAASHLERENLIPVADLYSQLQRFVPPSRR